MITGDFGDTVRQGDSFVVPVEPATDPEVSRISPIARGRSVDNSELSWRETSVDAVPGAYLNWRGAFRCHPSPPAPQACDAPEREGKVKSNGRP